MRASPGLDSGQSRFESIAAAGLSQVKVLRKVARNWVEAIVMLNLVQHPELGGWPF